MKHLGKRLLAAGMSAAMVLGSLGVVSAEDSTSSTVTGTADDVTIESAFGASTGSVTLSGDFELTYTFHNVSNGADNWDNFIVEMNYDGVYLDVRSDNYGWIGYGADTDTISFGDGSSDWETWAAAMQEGQDVTVTVVKTGSSVVVTTTAAGETFTATAYVSVYKDSDLTVYLTGEECTISDVSYSYTLIESEEIEYVNTISEEGTADDAVITGAFSAHTGELTLSGDFELTYTFHNVSTGTDNWDNYIVEMNYGGVYLDVRSDNYGWIGYGAGTDTISFGDGSSDWTTWAAAMQEGEDVTVTVVRSGKTITVTTTAVNETFTTTAYVSEYINGSELTVYLTGEECKISDVSYSYTASTNDYIEFLGGSLRMDYGSDSYDQTSLRFGYTITVPEDATNISWSWDWGYDGESKGTVEGVNYVNNGDGTYTSNVVVTGIPAAYYDTELYAQLTVEYTLADGTTITVTEANAQERSVDDVANAILASDTATTDEQTYAKGILDN